MHKRAVPPRAFDVMLCALRQSRLETRKSASMKIAVMGSGGVGGFYGGRLAHAGCDVAFIARGAHLAAMRENGLVIENETEGNIRLPRVTATDTPETIGTVDLVLVAVKLWQTQAAADAVKTLVGPDTAVLSLQN